MARSMETMSRSKIIPAGGKARTAGGESGGGGDRNRTDVSRFCRPLPYRLATPPARGPEKTQWRKILPGGREAVNQQPKGRVRAGPRRRPARILERETGVEPATSTLARLHSTTELFPLAPGCARRAEILPGDSGDCQGERAGPRLRRTRRRPG